MLSSYLKIAVKVLLRRKFYTGISLFGIAFTLMVLVVVTALADEMLAPAYPESDRERMLQISRVRLRGPRFEIISGPGWALLDRTARDLPGVEREALITQSSRAVSFVDGERVESTLRRAEGAFWEIMKFDFLEGGPFTVADDRQGNFVAVINEHTRRRLFGGEPAVGQTLRADGQSFRVVGVVRDVPMTRVLSFSEIWVPLGTAKSTEYRQRLHGGFLGILLAESADRIPQIQEEFRRRLADLESPDPERFDTIESGALTFGQELAREFVGDGSPDSAPTGLFLAMLAGLALLFMALPALNLVNLSLSRILERSSEIGVRKAFGASSLTLVGQFLVESVILSLLGGLVGLVGAAAVLAAVNASGIIPYGELHLNLRVFGIGLLLAAAFGILSGTYPAWRMSRMQPVDALHGRA